MNFLLHFRRHSKSNRFALGAIGNLLLRICGPILMLGSQLVLARSLAVSEFGAYILVITGVRFVVTPLASGLQMATVRYVSAYRSTGNWGALVGLKKAFSFAASLCGLAAATVGIWIAIGSSGAQFEDYQRSIITGALLVPVLVFKSQVQGYLRGVKQVFLSGALGLTLQPLLFCVSVWIGSKLFGPEFSSGEALQLNLFTSLVTLIVGWAVANRFSRSERISDCEPRYNVRLWFSSSFYMGVVSTAQLVIKQSDILLVGYFIGARETAVYAIAVRFALLVPIGLQAVASMAAPYISESFEKNDRRRMQEVLSLAAWGTFVCTGFIVAVFVVGGPWLLEKFGPVYGDAYCPLLILMVGQIANALAGTVGLLLSMTGHERTSAKIVGLVSLINVLLACSLVPEFGMIGSAVVSTVSTILINGWMLYYALKKTGINPTILRCLSNEPGRA